MLALWLLAIGANVQVRAPEGCEVSALSGLRADEGVTITASITAGSAYSGTVSLEASGRRFPARSVTAARCEEVAEALALIAELAIDRLPVVGPPMEPHGAIAPAARVRTAIHPLGLEPAWYVSTGIHGGASFGRAPSVRPTALPFVELSRDPWSLRASLLWAHRPSEELSVTLVAARLEVCPIRWIAADVELDPCASIELGAIRGERSEARSGLWLAPGALARGRWRFAHPFFAELELGASVPLSRPRFLLEPAQTLWHAPPIAFSAAAGLGATIW